jgi:hypothetical protein
LDQGTAAKLSVVKLSREEAILTYRIFNTVQQALKKKIITVFEPRYLEFFNDDMVGFAKTTAQEMLDQLFITYGNNTAIDLDLFLSRCAILGIPISQWRPCSSRFKIVLISRRQDDYLLANRRKSTWGMPIILPQAT